MTNSATLCDNLAEFVELSTTFTFLPCNTKGNNREDLLLGIGVDAGSILC